MRELPYNWHPVDGIHTLGIHWVELIVKLNFSGVSRFLLLRNLLVCKVRFFLFYFVKFVLVGSLKSLLVVDDKAWLYLPGQTLVSEPRVWLPM